MEYWLLGGGGGVCVGGGGHKNFGHISSGVEIFFSAGLCVCVGGGVVNCFVYHMKMYPPPTHTHTSGNKWLVAYVYRKSLGGF